ncbi:hypothetical protein OAP11_02825 [Bacteroidia bacterium]|nr:hypothetical protein [Bacteroidia bacterium]
MRFWIITLFFCLPSISFAQSEVKTSQAFLFTPHISRHWVGGDLDKRFYDFNAIGMDIAYKFKSNLIMGVDYDWFYGQSVKDEGIFSQIDGNSGLIIDKNGDFSVINLNIKGFTSNFYMGYLINMPKIHSNSGLLVSMGAGFMQHKIDLFSSQITIPQLNGEYEKGYDKLTYGFATKQYIGYQHLVNHNRYHYRIGLVFNQGFTEGQRTWDFNANTSGKDKRFDTSVALQLGLIVPIYTKKAEDEEFFYY